MAVKKILFFTSGVVPTTDEATAIAALQANLGYNVEIRNVQEGAVYGSNIEACDGVAQAGATFPTAFQTLVSASTIVDYSAQAAGGPANAAIFAPAGVSFAHTGTLQLCFVAEDESGVLTDQTKNAAWTSGTTGTATVGASTGLVTGVAAGSTVITGVLTIGSKTTTKTITLTAT